MKSISTPITPGCYVQFAGLPSDIHATPIKVAEVKDGYARLEGRNYEIPLERLKRVDVFEELRKQARR